MTDLAPLHPSHATETTPLFFAALKAHNVATIVADVRNGLDLPHVPVCRPTKRRLQILNGGIGVHGALVSNV